MIKQVTVSVLVSAMYIFAISTPSSLAATYDMHIGIVDVFALHCLQHLRVKALAHFNSSMRKEHGAVKENPHKSTGLVQPETIVTRASLFSSYMRTGMVGKNLTGTIASPLLLVGLVSLNCSTSFLASQ